MFPPLGEIRPTRAKDTFMRSADNCLQCDLKNFVSFTSFFQTLKLHTITVIWNILSDKHLNSAGQCPKAIHSFGNAMDASYLSSTEKALQHFQVNELQGLSEQQVQRALAKYGRNGTVHP